MLSSVHAARLLIAAARRAGTLRQLGDVPGHEFHGTLRTLRMPQETKLHQVASTHERAVAVAFDHAFAVARKVLKPDPVKHLEKALAAMRVALGKTLPSTLRKVLAAGGDAAGRQMKALGDYEGHTKNLSKKLKALEFRTAKRTSKKTKIDFTFDAENQSAIDWADRHAAELIDGIAETSREQINNAIADALESGDWKDALDEILDAVGDPERAALIARHETMLAASEGQRQAWDQAVDEGLLDEDSQRTWIVVGDDKVCPICEGLDGKTAKLGESYVGDDGEEYDGPPAHVACRCTEGLSG